MLLINGWRQTKRRVQEAAIFWTTLTWLQCVRHLLGGSIEPREKLRACTPILITPILCIFKQQQRNKSFLHCMHLLGKRWVGPVFQSETPHNLSNVFYNERLKNIIYTNITILLIYCNTICIIFNIIMQWNKRALFLLQDVKISPVTDWRQHLQLRSQSCRHIEVRMCDGQIRCRYEEWE